MSIDLDWVPVALSADIEAGTSAGAIVEGAEIVVWRDNKGAAHVWEDRCPHRGMRMSFGFVRGDHIACLYHGWQYDTAGQCRYIPAHPDLEVPATIKIPTYRSAEANGLIWAKLVEENDSSAPPVIDGETLPVRSLYLDCATETVIAALSDVVLPSRIGTTDKAMLDKAGANLWRLSSGGLDLLLALQPVGPAKTGLHILLVGDPSGTASSRTDVAKWATALRHQLEQAQAGAEAA